MFPPQCLFCAHTNPAGAKFCNECGAPLHLRPCNRCEAINDQVAKNCYQCGIALSMPGTAPETAPAWPALDPVAASASLSDLCLESGHASLTESVTERQDVRPLQSGDETAAGDRAVEVIAHAPRAPAEDMTSPVSTENRAADAIPLHDPGTTTEPHRLSRSTLAAVLSVALLTAVGVSGYYAYRHQTELVPPLSAAVPNPAVPTEVTAPPANPSVTPATAAAGDDGRMRAPGESDTTTTPQRISTTDQAAPPQQSATEPAEVAKAPSAAAPAQQLDAQAGEAAKAPSATAPAQQSATQAGEDAKKAPSATAAVAAQPRHKTPRTGARRRTATHSSANSSASTKQDAAAAAPVQKRAKAKRKPVPQSDVVR